MTLNSKRIMFNCSKQCKNLLFNGLKKDSKRMLNTIVQPGTKIDFKKGRQTGSENSDSAAFTMNIIPPPSSLPKYSKTNKEKKSRWRRLFRNAGIGLLLTGGGVYIYDNTFGASIITRSSRAIATLLIIALDFKINFDKDKDITGLYRRVANRLHKLILVNKGLYIKFGQTIGAQSGMFPDDIAIMFTSLFDSAPISSWESILSEILVPEFGSTERVEEVFSYINPVPEASASIAQVHRGIFRKDGSSVAIKVQHPEINKQVSMDLAVYRLMMRVYSYLFDMPLDYVANYVSSQVQQETDFCHEAKNAIMINEVISSDSEFSSKVYVPRVYTDISTSRVLVMEWVDNAVRLSDKEGIRKAGFSFQEILKTLTGVFAAQIFKYGVVHCDPHPGNIFVRRKKNGSGMEVVLVDYGLAIKESDKFRLEYCELWRGLFTFNFEEVKKVCEAWGLGNQKLFASNVLLRSYPGDDAEIDDGKKGGNSSNDKEMFNAQADGSTDEDPMLKPGSWEHEREMRDDFRSFIKNAQKLPLEIIFVGRVMRILQGLNRMYDSPVNRINILARYAVAQYTYSDVDPMSGRKRTFWEKISVLQEYMFMKISFGISDIVFSITRVINFFTNGNNGMEDIIDRQMNKLAKQR